MIIQILGRRVITREGYKVTQAYDGEEVVQQLTDANSFDLILLDLMLPKRSGMDLLQLIRRDGVVPVLILSAKDSDLNGRKSESGPTTF